jgi:hypothetical protein
MGALLLTTALDSLAAFGPLGGSAVGGSSGVVWDEFVLVNFDHHGGKLLLLLLLDAQQSVLVLEQPLGLLGNVVVGELLDGLVDVDGVF